jgi:hypothetical protein
MAMCAQLKETIDKEPSPKKREALLHLYKEGMERMKSAAGNMGGMQSASLQINFLADLSDSVMKLQESMKQMQAQLHNIEQGLLLLTGQPVEQVINFYCERELKHATALPSKVYVPIDGVRIGENRRNSFVVSEDNPAKGLEDEVMEFLKKDDKSVLLVSGYSGSGKSTLAKRIRLRLWKQHQEELKQRAIVAANEDAEAGTPAPKQPLIVPVWVHLPTLAVPLSDLMHESLAKQHGFGEAQLREFENKVHAGEYRLVIVMDGVDELKKEFAKNNLYDRNDLELWREEKTETESWPKVLYFCRAEMLQPDSYPGYEKHFAPSADSGRLSDAEVAKTYFDELVSVTVSTYFDEKTICVDADLIFMRTHTLADRTLWDQDGNLHRGVCSVTSET